MSTTINKEEIQKFSRLADEWWDVNGKFKPLHMFNPIRIEYITENIKKQFNVKNLSHIICRNINKELNSSIPKDAPDYFFLGIQKDEKNLPP